MESGKKANCTWAIVSFLGFALLWSCWILLNRQYHFGDMINGVLGFGDLLWLASGAVLITINRKRLFVSPKEMFATVPKLSILLPLLAIIVLYYVSSMLLNHGGFYINPDRNIPRLIGMFTIVAIQEELLFRGWFLNIFASVVTDRKANLLSALFFMLIHYPGWIIAAVPFPSLLVLSVSTFVLGVVFGWSFRKNHSIWTPIFLHMIWDVFSYLV